MPYPMVHMVIAYKILEKSDRIKEPGDFILGSVAPDAVHFHNPYEVHRKEISHLWDCGPRWGVTTESERWKSNICGFWEQHKKDDNRDFIAGYCVHILTDWMNDRTIWAPFRERILQGEDYDKVYAQSRYREEGYGFDQWLNQTSSYTGEIWELLLRSRVYEVEGKILAEDLMRQKQSILTEQFKQEIKYDIRNYHYCSQEAMTAYMAECVDTIEELIRL